MSDLIHIKHNDNVYLLRDEPPGYGELSIYMNEDKTRVSKRANPDGEKYRHVKVEWMYEKEKIAFNSYLMYVNVEISSRGVHVEVNEFEVRVSDNTRGVIDWMEEWTRAINNHIEIKTDKE